MSGAYRSADATVAAKRAVSVTPTDGVLIPTTRSLYIGTSGNLAVRMAEDDQTIVFQSVPAGVFPVQVVEVLFTNTTAQNIIALY
jgi:hypothetical protein